MLKKISLITSLAALGLSSVAFADAQKATMLESTPYFLGLQLGTIALNYNAADFSKVRNTSVDNHKFASRIYGGYIFNKYLSAQVGYTYFNKVTFHDNKTGLKESFYQNAFDAVGVAKAPFDYGLSMYAKAGLEWVFRGVMTDNDYFVGHAANNKVVALIGGGVSYDINSSLAANAEWTMTTKKGNLPRSDLYMVGMVYKFNI
jgi:hypothetical protein